MPALPSWLFWTRSSPPPPEPELPPSPPPPPPPPPTPPSPPPGLEQLPAARLLRQAVLPATGALFFLLSLRLTQRSIRRRFPKPPPFHPNNGPPLRPSSGALDALEALQLATLHVISFGMVAVGGAGLAMDVSNLEELRAKFRESAGGKEWEEGKRKADEEWEEWVVGVLERKRMKEAAAAGQADGQGRNK